MSTDARVLSATSTVTQATVPCRAVPMEQVCIPNAHVGFIDWEEYRRNRATMASNAAAFGPSGSRVAAPRKGAALLQSRVLCGHCGRRMSPLYNYAWSSRNESSRYHYHCREEQVRYRRTTCQRIRADLVDAAISRFVIAVMNRENINLALAVQEQVRSEFAEADAQRANRIEALRYEADLARRRFFAVDPANRLAAAALEADWNDRLRQLEEAWRERVAHVAARDTEISERQVERIGELTRDFERVWNAPETEHKDRKRLLGLLIEDATLTRNGYEVRVDLRMRGGRTLSLDTVSLPRPIAQLRKTPSATLAALDQLLETQTDEDAARELNRRGYRNWKGERYTAKRVRGTRLEYGLPSYLERERDRLRSRGFRTAEEVAAQLGVKPGTIRERARENMSQGLEREIISTGGRRYCMYRLRDGGERPRIPARSCGGSRKSTDNTPPAEQGAT